MDLDAAIYVLQGPKVNTSVALANAKARLNSEPMGDQPVSDEEFMKNAVEQAPLSGAMSVLSGTEEQPKTITPVVKASPFTPPEEKGNVVERSLAGLGKAQQNLVTGAGEAALNQVSGIGSAIVSGWKGLADLGSRMMQGESFDKSSESAAQTVNESLQRSTYQPQTKTGEALTGIANSPYNPLNWYGMMANKAGEWTTDVMTYAGASPKVSAGAGTAVNTGLNALPLVLMAKQGFAQPEETVLAGKPRLKLKTPPVEDVQPITGQVTAPADRAAVLQRIGLNEARQSAITGDKLAGASDFQTTKFNEPAGELAKQQFIAERSALENHAANIIKNTGGTLGMESEDLHARGRTITAPLDGLNRVLSDKTSQLYKAAEDRLEAQAVIQPSTVDSVLKNPDFRETMLAKDQGGLLGSIERQFERFQKENPEGLTVKNAEGFRKWLNSIWTPDTSNILGQVKGAIDNDVFQAAGQDIFSEGRKLHAIKQATLDNPTGISKIMDFDPRTPVNRAVAFENIPDYVTRLPIDQFNHVTDVLKNISSSTDYPPELRAQAQASLNEIKAHMGNQILQTGTKFKGGWNAQGVTQKIGDNFAKIKNTFSPQEIAQLKDLNDAGHILSVDQSYPGAAAQAANAVKRGLGSVIVKRIGAPVGGAVGGALLGPAGAAGGAMAGEAAAEKLSSGMAEAKAARGWRSRMVNIRELAQ